MPFDNPHQMPFGDLELLRTARRYIDEPGKWIQYKYVVGDSYCAVGAVAMACRDNPRRLSAQSRSLLRQLRREMSYCRRLLTVFFTAKATVIFYNDSGWRRYDDVIGLFDCAIARLETRATVDVFVYQGR